MSSEPRFGTCLQASCKSKVTSKAKEVADRDARIQQLETALQRDGSQAQKRADIDAQAIASRDDTIAELEVLYSDLSAYESCLIPNKSDLHKGQLNVMCQLRSACSRSESSFQMLQGLVNQ